MLQIQEHTQFELEESEIEFSTFNWLFLLNQATQFYNPSIVPSESENDLLQISLLEGLQTKITVQGRQSIDLDEDFKEYLSELADDLEEHEFALEASTNNRLIFLPKKMIRKPSVYSSRSKLPQ